MATFIYPSVAISTTGLATEAKQDTMITELQSANTTLTSLDGKDYATETTLASLDGKDFATSAKQDTIITAIQSLDAGLDVVDQIDTTPLLDTSSTNIPGSAGSPVEIVASTAADIKKLISVEDIGEFIGIYTGAAASEVLKAVLPPGDRDWEC